MDNGVSINDTISKRFEQRYSEWSSYIRNMNSYSSSDRDYVQNSHFEAIIDLGSEAVPFIMAKLKSEEHAHFLVHALAIITGKRFSAEEIATYRKTTDSPLGNQAMAEVWLSWWDAQQI